MQAFYGRIEACTDGSFDFDEETQVEDESKLKKSRQEKRKLQKEVMRKVSINSSQLSNPDSESKPASNQTGNLNLTPGIPLEDLSLAFDEKPELGCNRMMLLFFCGVAGLGKSSLVQMAKKLCRLQIEIFFQQVSSDESQKETIDNFQFTNPSVSRNECVERCREATNKIFEGQIDAAIGKLKFGYNLVVLDKNSVPNDLLRRIKSSSKLPGSFKTDFVCILPESKGHFRFGSKKHSVPFSASLILNLCVRVMLRISHPTIKQTQPNSEKIFLVLSFVLRFKNIKHIQKEIQKKLAGAVSVSYFKVPFCSEVRDEKIDPTAL